MSNSSRLQVECPMNSVSLRTKKSRCILLVGKYPVPFMQRSAQALPDSVGSSELDPIPPFIFTSQVTRRCYEPWLRGRDVFRNGKGLWNVPITSSRLSPNC